MHNRSGLEREHLLHILHILLLLLLWRQWQRVSGLISAHLSPNRRSQRLAIEYSSSTRPGGKTYCGGGGTQASQALSQSASTPLSLETINQLTPSKPDTIPAAPTAPRTALGSHSHSPLGAPGCYPQGTHAMGGTRRRSLLDGSTSTRISVVSMLILLHENNGKSLNVRWRR